eukprot:COSAG01_NODE_2350_length_7855_cov_9.576973_1_plen_150_part_00
MTAATTPRCLWRPSRRPPQSPPTHPAEGCRPPAVTASAGRLIVSANDEEVRGIVASSSAARGGGPAPSPLSVRVPTWGAAAPAFKHEQPPPQAEDGGGGGGLTPPDFSCGVASALAAGPGVLLPPPSLPSANATEAADLLLGFSAALLG